MSKKSIVSLAVGVLLVFGVASIFAATHYREPVKKAESKVILNADETASAFNTARRAAETRYYRLAALEVRRVEASIRAEAANASEDSRIALVNQADNLEMLAKRFDKRMKVTVKDMDNEFARTHQVLAKYHYTLAREARDRNDNKIAGYEIQQSASHLGKAMTMLGHKTESSVVTDAKAFGAKMEKGAAWTEDEARSVWDKLGSKIDEIGESLKQIT